MVTNELIKKNSYIPTITIEQGDIRVIKKRFRGMNVDYIDVLSIIDDLGYTIGDISDASYFIICRQIELLIVDKIGNERKDIIYVVPRYTPEIKRTVVGILKRNDIKANVVVGLLRI